MTKYIKGNFMGWKEMIPNGYLDIQEKLNTRWNGKVMWRYRRLDFPINLYKAHGSLKTKITTFPCGNYIYIFNTHGKYAQRIWGCMTIFCGKIFIFNMKCCEVKWKLLSCVRFFATPWTIQSMEFSRPEYWTG